jgi:putative flippase GtrA
VVQWRAASRWIRLAAGRTAPVLPVRLLSGRFLRFCVVGVSGYLINLVVYSTLLSLSVEFRAAAAVSVVVSVSNNYILHRLWTFADRRGSFATQVARFVIVSLVALGVNELWLTAFVGLGVEKILAEAAACILVIPISFLGNEHWAFRRPAVPIASARVGPVTAEPTTS